jgi:hypothetical protein
VPIFSRSVSHVATHEHFIVQVQSFARDHFEARMQGMQGGTVTTESLHGRMGSDG